MVDSKQSIYYLELESIFKRVCDTPDNLLPDLQNEIDSLFTNVVKNKFMHFSSEFGDGLKVYFDCLQSFKSKTTMDIKVVSYVLLKELLKVLQSFEGIEEQRFRANVLRRLRREYKHDLDEFTVIPLIVAIVSMVMLSGRWWSLKVKTVKTKNISFIVPSDCGFNL